MRYFGNFNLELRYCGILQTCGMRFLGVLDDDSWYRDVSFTFFRPFLAVSGRFGSNLKQLCVLTTSLKPCQCFHGPPPPPPPLVITPLFALASANPPATPAYYEIALFSGFFCDIAVFAEFFAVMHCSATPQCPPPNTLLQERIESTFILS